MKILPIRGFLTLAFTGICLSLAPYSLAQRSYVHLYGDPAPATVADKTIEIRPDTRHVNVVGGDIVQFLVNGKSFTWRFNVARTVSAFDLKEVAPAGLLDRTIMAYVSPDPRYFSVP
ncbi:CzcE family metal-binding protein [Noviherbaspirillum sp.]|uniref:CzcE family metal-binding protein n=1 Tax=Noviherbaspirillum sp. TaxID=1926288 RepID=UPI002FE009F5